jgi:hypothetical protein
MVRLSENRFARSGPSICRWDGHAGVSAPEPDRHDRALVAAGAAGRQEPVVGGPVDVVEAVGWDSARTEVAGDARGMGWGFGEKE